MLTAFLVSAVIALLVLTDQLIKVWAIHNLQGQPPRPFLPFGSFNWMNLRYLENRGAAFSMLSGSRLFLIVFPIIVVTAGLYALHRYGRGRKWLYAAVPLIVAGGLGNLYDRIFRGGAVVDYLDLQLFRFAVFNFADICVTVGVGILAIGLLFLENDLPDAKKAPLAGNAPYARLAPALPEAAVLPDAGSLPAAGTLPEAEALPAADTEDTQDDA
jgi:signal peptidase II